VGGVLVYYPGDIVGVKSNGFFHKLLNYFVYPKTDRHHFFIIGERIPWSEPDDYVIYESIGKGIAVGRLSFYKDQDIEVYRVTAPNWKLLGRKAVFALTWYGRASYDFVIYAKLIAGVPLMLLRHGLPPWKPAMFPYGRNSLFLCTEAAEIGYYDIGHYIIPKGTVPLPNAFKQAEYDGTIKRIFPVYPEDAEFVFNDNTVTVASCPSVLVPEVTPLQSS
jgi:hypothetical protein